MEKWKYRLFILVLLLMVCGVGIYSFLGLKTKDKNNDNKDNEVVYTEKVFKNSLTSKVSQTMKDEGYVSRRGNVSVSNEGLNARYPVYGTVLSNISDEEKDNLISENSLLRASDTTYNSMDKDGNLYLNGESINKKLYKHTFSNGLYFGNVDDNQKAIKRTITIKPGEKRNYITGLYAPAGEVIKFEMSDESLSNTNGYKIVIGQVTHTNWALEITKGRNDFSRMPNLSNALSVNEKEVYFGSFFGGPIYINPNNIDKEFTITITGAIEYFCYIHGYTTETDVIRMKESSAPYFDFEVWDKGVRHSGPRQDINFSFEELYNMGELWEKISRTSRNAASASNTNLGVSVIYDTFVFVGSACAFKNHATWINAPTGWLKSSVDYNEFVKKGSWGIIHEFNHHYQEFGISDNTEITNNAMSIVSYVLYTNISSLRGENDSSITGWNKFTDPYRSLKETLSKSKSSNEAINYLGIYTDLIHSFGTDVFIEAVKKGANSNKKTNSYDYWYEAISEASGYDMTYYFENILHYNISNEFKEKYQNKNLPVFIPVSSLYQVGREIETEKGKEFIRTVRPFVIKKGQEYVLDFSRFLAVPDDFTWRIKNVEQPASGNIEKIDELKYKYIPSSEIYSGEFKVVVELENDTYGINEVVLLIDLKQEQELEETFLSEKVYISEYKVNETLKNEILKDVTIISSNMNPWDDNYAITNIFDDNDESHFHNEKNNFVSEDNPFQLVIDLKKETSANSFIIHGRNNSKVHMPISFKLYGGNDLENLSLIGEYNNLSYSNLKQQVYFDKTSFRYLKLVVTDTDSHQYVAISKLELVEEFKGDLGQAAELKYYEYDDHNFVKLEGELSSFNYLIKGNGIIKYQFKGKGFGMYLKTFEDVKIEVKVDDRTFEVEINKNDNIKFYNLISNLAYDNHSIEIKVLSGNLYIDSIGIEN